MEPLKRVERKIVKKGNIIDLYEDTIQLPDGTVQHYDFINHKGAAAVLPVMEDGKILMVKQYRNALDRFTLELPAGGRNGADEPTILCAARELEEETGYKSDHLEQLLSIKTTVAFCNELIDIYVATDLKKSHQHLDEGEFVDVAAYDIMELVQMVYDFTIQDAKTVAAIMTYYAKYVLKN
ncbi:MAG: NUDIX hydrolase [Lachnospiraceae bacterium]|nr:NUDIX hydrolase [Lachnospiraceae bacterium]